MLSIGLYFVFVSNDNYLAYSLPSNPQQQPIPEIDYDDPARSIIVKLLFKKASPSPTSIEQATPILIEVGPERARTHIGDPPLLKVWLLDKNLMTSDIFNTWNPLWTFFYDQSGKEHAIIQKEANGTIIFPFHRNLGYMELYSLPTGKFITRVNLTSTVERFCTENPRDPNCKLPVTKPSCKDNPTDPNCNPTTHKDFCKNHPEDPRCKRSLGSFQANLTNSSLANSTSLVNSSLMNKLSNISSLNSGA
jgi:hypothetical protein